ncbi:MAG TPA: SBBP repeat-containing protein, partial [Blastocatellia bacterium]|nr:SBBP repeat-containing protein [Blastocatellia bacterium]
MKTIMVRLCSIVVLTVILSISPATICTPRSSASARWYTHRVPGPEAFESKFNTRPLTTNRIQLAAGPGLSYSTYLGGARNEEGNSIAVDSAGNVYVVGFTDSANFPLVNPSQPNFGGGPLDAFIAKLDPSGNRLIYATFVGGNGQDNATAIAVDGAGNAYITGFTNSTNFPVKDALQKTKLGEFNAFVLKLNSAGAVVYSTL